MELTAVNGKVFKIKGTNQYLPNKITLGSKVAVLNNGKVVSCIELTRDMLEQVDPPMIREEDLIENDEN